MAEPWTKEFWSAAESGGDSAYQPAQAQVFLPVMPEDVARQKRKVVLTAIAAVLMLAGLLYVLYLRLVDPFEAKLSYDSGVSLFQAGRFELAIRYFDRAIDLKSGFADAYHMRARASLGANRRDAAISDFTRFVKLKPGDPGPIIERGFVYLVKGDYARAIADATAALALDARLGRAYDLRATAYRAGGDMRRALADYTTALGIDPDLDHYFQRAATYQLLGEHRLAIADLDQAILLSPRQPDMYFARAESRGALGDNVGAMEDIQLGRRIRLPTDPKLFPPVTIPDFKLPRNSFVIR